MVLERASAIATSPLKRSDVAVPKPGRGEVVVTVNACGVCRTDLQICEGDIPLRKRPVIPGHQIVGHIAELGAGVTTLAVGDRVGVGWLASACGACKAWPQR